MHILKKTSLLFFIFFIINNYASAYNSIYNDWNSNNPTYQVVDNISELRTLNITDYEKSIMVKVLGYYKPGDGGGGDFYLETTSTEAENGSTIIKSAVTKGVFKRLYSGAINVLWFGTRQNINKDQASALNKAIKYAFNTGDAVFMPNGVYHVKSTIHIYVGTELTGENMKNTELRCDISGDFALMENRSSKMSDGGRTSLKSFRINTKSHYGLLYITDQKHYPFTASLERIEVVANQKGAFKESVAIKIEGLSHAQFDTVICASTGTAFIISGDKFNTGVMTFNNCFFGNTSTNKIGFHFENGKALDSYVFNSCYFGGTHVSELIGNGNNTVIGATHNACHFENSKGKSDDRVGSALIQFNLNNYNEPGYGAIGFSWNNCTLGSNNTVKSAIKFNKGYYKGITFTGTRIVNTGKAPDFFFDEGTVFIDCEINGLSSQTISDKTIIDKTIVWENRKGITYGWNVLNNGYYHLQNGIKTDERPVRLIDDAKNIPNDVHYNKGDIYYNSNPKKRAYIGWICVKSGIPGKWRKFGKIK